MPVLLNEVIVYLKLKPRDKIIDATFSSGGHAEKILEKIRPDGKLLGIELDTELFNKAKEKFSKTEEVVLVNSNYQNLKKIAKDYNFIGADGILLDLGLSSWHFEESKRGFSFQKDELLDMRFWQGDELAAKEIINQWPPEEIEKILKEYGEEKFARQISKAIIETRKKKSIISTFQLVEVIKNAVPFWYRSGRRTHFATKTFQALRIEVNNELENLKSFLKQLPEVLKKGGRGVVIS